MGKAPTGCDATRRATTLLSPQPKPHHLLLPDCLSLVTTRCSTTPPWSSSLLTSVPCHPIPARFTLRSLSRQKSCRLVRATHPSIHPSNGQASSSFSKRLRAVRPRVGTQAERTLSRRLWPSAHAPIPHRPRRRSTANLDRVPQGAKPPPRLLLCVLAWVGTTSRVTDRDATKAKAFVSGSGGGDAQANKTTMAGPAGTPSSPSSSRLIILPGPGVDGYLSRSHLTSSHLPLISSRVRSTGRRAAHIAPLTHTPALLRSSSPPRSISFSPHFLHGSEPTHRPPAPRLPQYQ